MEKRWEQEAAGFGMVRVTPAALRQALLPDFLPEMAGKTVKLKAASNSEMVEKVAYLLADRARYVELDITWGQEELAKKLWQRYGLSRTGGEPWLTVDFTDTVPGALSLGSGGTMEVFWGDLPLSEEMATVLFQCGAVKKEELQVKSLPRNA